MTVQPEQFVSRAPDNQPTENIRLLLSNEQKRLDYWEQTHTVNLRAVNTSNKAVARARNEVAELEGQLAIREQEELERIQEVNGL